MSQIVKEEKLVYTAQEVAKILQPGMTTMQLDKLANEFITDAKYTISNSLFAYEFLNLL